ncbi:SusC/RagA family TonB-linked outer membrane protein [Deminuibacter soli]|uniref:TonB-dependent receptor n=1 Tax=Deminuibacter soli TaxID=2291815 RepID=A0A3E1NDF8_9BACT|nr:TonB-dependent receptor [Deminuibacter soli]RFM25907.1 TonB-dependent receptor [Deminuibacter soli]
MRKSLLAILWMCLTLPLFSQTRTISGKIIDAKDSTAIPGATITIKGSRRSVASDANGSFSLQADEKARELVISSVGYINKEVNVLHTSSVLVVLSASEQSLSEVVVVGYGTRLRKDITGSVAKVNAGDIANTPATSFESAIQGRASGVLVSQQSGKLGQGINIRIRGASSVTAGSDPLYVVDGMPVTSGDQSSTTAATNPLADINMNDIESVEILKDASAAAIYGSRASNGVVLITTKKGKTGSSKIDLGYFTGYQKPTRKRHFLNAQQYVDYFEQAALGAARQDVLAGYYDNIDDAIADEKDYVESRFTRYAAGKDTWKTGAVNTDWQDHAFQNAPLSQYDLNVSGGNEKTKFFLSGQYLDQKGIILKNSYKRYGARLNLEHKVRSWLTAGLNLSFARSLNYRVSDDDQFSTPLQIIALSPITPYIDPRTGLTSGALDTTTGRPNTNYPVYYNPVLSAENQYYHTLVNRTIGNAFLSAAITKELSFRTEFGMDQLNQTEDIYGGKLTARNSGVPDGYGAYYTTQIININTNNYFNFNKTFATDHNIDAVLGMSYQSYHRDYSQAKAEEFPSDLYVKLASGASKTEAYTSSNANALVSYFLRANYKFQSKYLLGISGRIDGYSAFGKDNRYGFFPAASAGWILSEEKFLKNVSWLNFLKVKASIGLTGNNRIDDYAALGLYSATAYGGQAGQHPTQLPNPALKWETTLGTDYGVEASILHNRVSIEVDYYERHTKDLLLNVDVPGTSGFSTQLQNVGKLRNKGIEFTLNTTNVVTRDFKWTSSLNFGANKNKVTNLGGQVVGSGVNRAMEGQPLGVFVAREFAGADPANGDALYYKNTPKADGTIDHSTTNDYNAATDVVIGNPNPDYIYGFGNTFTYKGFDLDVLLQGVQGNQIFMQGGQYMSASGSNGFDNQTTDQLAAWKKPGDITMVPEARLFYPNGIGNSSRYIETGSYLRVKAVTLAYNLPKSLIGKIGFERIRIYAKAQNLFTITKYKGWDPEVNADYLAGNINQGLDFYSAPQLKSIVFGVNIGL